MNEVQRLPTAFEEKVYDAVKLVPRGRVTTYRGLGLAIGCRSSRAVGQALRRNPYAPGVPCHRVIKSDRRIGGFAGEVAGEEIERKRKLLEDEGVVLDGKGLVPEDRIFEY